MITFADYLTHSLIMKDVKINTALLLRVHIVLTCLIVRILLKCYCLSLHIYR